MTNNEIVVNIKEFVDNFVDGVENILLETNKITLYVDEPLADFLDIEVDNIDDELLNHVINLILLHLIQKDYSAGRASSNEITVIKEDQKTV